MLSNRRVTSSAASAGRHRTGSTDSSVAGPSLTLAEQQHPEGPAGAGPVVFTPKVGKASSSVYVASHMAAGKMVDPDPDLLNGAPRVNGGSSSPQLLSEEDDAARRLPLPLPPWPWGACWGRRSSSCTHVYVANV